MTVFDKDLADLRSAGVKKFFLRFPQIGSLLFKVQVEEMGLAMAGGVIARQLHKNGYAVLDFSDPDLDQRIDSIKQHLDPSFGIALDDPELHSRMSVARAGPR